MLPEKDDSIYEYSPRILIEKIKRMANARGTQHLSVIEGIYQLGETSKPAMLERWRK